MKNFHFDLVVALLTFAIGVFIASVWVNFNPVDKRLANALSVLYSEETNRTCRKHSLSTEGCEKLKAPFLENKADRPAKDVADTEIGCKVNYLYRGGMHAIRGRRNQRY